MTIVYPDKEIFQLVNERKPLPKDWHARLELKAKRNHQECQLDCSSVYGNSFRIILRQSTVNVLDFSAILTVRVPQSNRLFRLRRYNGKSHEHTNGLEGETFYDYHIHIATERYQELGSREDSYAEITERYNDLYGALGCLFGDAGFDVPPLLQTRLF